MSHNKMFLPIKGQLARGGMISFLINSIGMSLSLLMQILLARLLGPSDYGIYAFVTTVITFMAFPTKLGFDVSIVRFVSVYHANGEWNLIRGMLRRANQLGLNFSILGALIGLVYIFFNRNEMVIVEIIAYVSAFITLPLLTLGSLRQSALRALKDVMFSQLPEKLLLPILTMIFIYIILLTGGNLNAGIAMVCFSISIVITYIIGAIVLKRRLVKNFFELSPRYESKVWFRVSTSLMINAGMYLIIGQLNILMSGIIIGEIDAGLFSAAVRLASLVTFMITAVNLIASPLISQSFAKSDLQELQQVCTMSSRIGFAFASLVFFFFLLCGRWLLGLFGPDFVVAYPALLILSFGQLFSAFCGQSGTVALMTGKERMQTKILAVAAIFNISLNIALIPYIGIFGGAIAAAFSVIFWNLSTVIMVKRTIGIQTFVWFKKREGN